MKNSYKLFSVVLAALTLGAVACTEKNEPYQVPEAETGAQFYFATTTPTSYKITPTVESFKIPVYRAAKDMSAIAKVTVTDTSKTVFAEGSKVFDISFITGQTSADVVLPIVFENFKYGDLFGLTLEIADETTVYAPSTLKIEISLPEPWKSLGKTGKFYDGFFMDSPVSGVEIEQNELYPNQFRVIKPYAKAPNVSGLSKPGNATEYIYLTLMKPGDKDPVRDITITENDLVYFQTYYSGYFHDSYGDDIKIYWPGVFNSQSTEDKWLFNKVLSYQSDGPDALPAQIQLAPFYYMDSVGGWNYTQKDGMILITFPGAVIKDYSIAAEFEGILTNEEGDFALVDVALGEDVDAGYAAIVPGSNPQDALDLILAGDEESVITLDKSGSVKFPLTEPAQTYSYVVVSYAAGDFQEMDYATIDYKDFSIAINAKEAVMGPEGVSGTVEASVTLGKDVEFGKIALLAKDPKELTNDDLNILLEEGAENVFDVRYSGQEFTFDLPKAGVYSLLAASFAADEAWKVATAKVELSGMTFVYFNNFEDVNTLGQWMIIDADGDGANWGYSTELAAHSGVGILYSQSYNSSGALHPDNWIVTEPIEFTEDNYLSFWVTAQDPSYAAEHYAVYFFTEALTAIEDLEKGIKIHEATFPEGNPAQEDCEDGKHTWQRFVYPVPAELAGKTGYIAFRHFNCSDYFYLNLDDVAVTEGNPVPEATEAAAPKAKARLFYNADFTVRKNMPAAKPEEAVVVATGKHMPIAFEASRELPVNIK